MNEAVLILPNMRGGCATVGGTVHAMFRVNGRRKTPMARPLQPQISENDNPPALHDALSLTSTEIAC